MGREHILGSCSRDGNARKRRVPELATILTNLNMYLVYRNKCRTNRVGKISQHWNMWQIVQKDKGEIWCHRWKLLCHLLDIRQGRLGSGNFNRENASIKLASGKSRGHVFKLWFMWKCPAHYGRYHPWTDGCRLFQKAGWESHEN